MLFFISLLPFSKVPEYHQTWETSLLEFQTSLVQYPSPLLFSPLSFQLHSCRILTLFSLSGSLIAMVLMDKVGRKLLLLWSFIGMVCVVHFFRKFLLSILSSIKLIVLMCIGSSNGTSSWCYKCILTTFFGVVFVCWWHSCVSVY